MEHHEEEEGGEVERGVDPVPGKILHLLSVKKPIFNFSEIYLKSKLNIDTDHALCCGSDFFAGSGSGFIKSRAAVRDTFDRIWKNFLFLKQNFVNRTPGGKDFVGRM